MEDTNELIVSKKLVMDDMIKKDTTPEVKHHMMPGMNKFAKLAQKKKLQEKLETTDKMVDEILIKNKELGAIEEFLISQSSCSNYNEVLVT